MTKENLEIVVTKEITAVEKKVETLIISAETMPKATEMLSQFNARLDAITAEKEKVTKPLNEALKAERARWSPAETKLEAFIKSIRTKMGAYQTEQTRLAKEEEAKIAARVGEGKGKLKVETAVKKIDEIDRPEAKVTADSGMIKFRTDKKLKITDETKIPRKYLVVDEKLLLADLKKGLKIAGAEVEEVQTPINFR